MELNLSIFWFKVAGVICTCACIQNFIWMPNGRERSTKEGAGGVATIKHRTEYHCHGRFGHWQDLVNSVSHRCQM